MPLSAVLFDLDGVLTDTAPAHGHSWAQVARRLGVPFLSGDEGRLRGVARGEALDWLLRGRPPLADDERRRMLDLKAELFRDQVRRMGSSVGVPGVAGLVRELRRREVAVAVASASRHAHLLLELAGLAPLLDAVSDGHFAGPPKPSPAQLDHLARVLGVEPRACVVVEDSAAGLEAARRAGMGAIGVGPVVRDGALAPRWVDSLAGMDADTFVRLALSTLPRPAPEHAAR